MGRWMDGRMDEWMDDRWADGWTQPCRKLTENASLLTWEDEEQVRWRHSITMTTRVGFMLKKNLSGCCWLPLVRRGFSTDSAPRCSFVLEDPCQIPPPHAPPRTAPPPRYWVIDTIGQLQQPHQHTLQPLWVFELLWVIENKVQMFSLQKMTVFSSSWWSIKDLVCNGKGHKGIRAFIIRFITCSLLIG